jgi:hypothetical protein
MTFMKRAILLICCFCILSDCLTQNLVVNPGFENWDKMTKPSGWTTVANCIRDSISIKSGSYSCSLASTASETKKLGQLINVVPGKQYSFSFYFKTIILNKEHGFRIWCDWKDINGNSVSDTSSTKILQPSTYIGSETWQLFSIVVKAPVNSARFNLEVRTYQNTTAYFDDFEFTETIETYTRKEILPESVFFYDNYSNTIHIKHLASLEHIEIINLTGFSIMSLNLNNESEKLIDMQSFPSGIYILRIKAGNSFITGKFIKL